MNDLAGMIANVIVTTLSLLALWGLVYWLYRDYRTDRFREEMFAIRDRLFDLADSGTVPFNHEAYGALRTTLNGFIRYGERLTLVSFVALPALLDEDDHYSLERRSFREQWESAVAGLPSSTRDELDGIVRAMHGTVAEQIVLSSPALVMTVVPVLLFFALQFFWKTILRHFAGTAEVLRQRMRKLDELAFAYGATAQTA